MKKRILSMVLAIVMIVTLVPAYAVSDKRQSETAEQTTEASVKAELLSAVAAESAEKASPQAAAAQSGTVAYAVTGGNIYFDPSTGTVTGCDRTVTEAIIPSSINGVEVKSIGGRAFYNCKSLTSVTIPIGVTNIGNSAFYVCASLTNVTISSSVTSIGDKAFYNCSSLTSVIIPNSVINIGDYAFYNCNSLTSVIIPNSVTSIGDYAFCNCNKLASVTISDGVTSIGEYAFQDCTSLPSVTIPSSVKSIDFGVFKGCKSLTSVTMPSGLTSVDGYAFRDCTSLPSVTIPNSVREIGGGAFQGCTSLMNVTIPSGVTNIADCAFYNCNSLTSVTIPDSVTSIGGYAFYRCNSLPSVTIPDSVTSIGGYAFQYCVRLENMTIPNSVSRIDSSAFSGCIGMRSINVVEDNSTYSSVAGVLFDKNIKTLIHCPARKPNGQYVIPNSVTRIDNYAFEYCSNLTSVTIPNSVMSIGYFAFHSCTSLTSVTIPNGVTSIESSTFSGCTSLISVTIPNGVTSIESSAFRDCRSLTNVTIPNGVTSIGSLAFSDCRSLTNVTIPNSVTSISYGAFNSCDSLTDVYYSGNEAQWKQISIGDNNKPLLNAKKHFDHIIANYTSIYDSDTGTLNLTIYGNKKDSKTMNTSYAAMGGVKVSGGKSEVESDKKGGCEVEKAGKALTFSKKGYVSRTIPLAALNVSQDVYLQKESKYPVISAVWMDDVYDIMNTEKALLLVQKDAHKVRAEISWGDSGAKRLVIYQGDKSVDISSETSFVWSDKFDLSKDIYVLATNQDGLTTTKKLKIKSGSQASDAINKMKVDLGDSLDFALPESVPVIGGKTLKVGGYSQIPVKVTCEDGKWYMAIGIQGDSERDKDGAETKSFAESAKELRDSLKKAKSQIEKYKAVRKAQKENKKLLANIESKWGVDAGCSVMGFAEGWYDDDGHLHFQDGGMVIAANVGVTWETQFTIGPVPCYFEVEFGGETEAQLNLLMSEAAKKFTPDGTVKGEVSLDIGGGVGIKYAVTVGGGAEGKLGLTVNYGTEDASRTIESAEAKFSLNGYFKATLFCLTYPHEFDPWVEKVIYRYPDPRKSAKSAAAFGVAAMYERVYNSANYGLPDLSYLEGGSSFVANGSGIKRAPSKAALDTSNILTTGFLNNTYEQAKPELLSMSDGTKLAVWLGYNSDSSSINAISLYYSYFDGSCWSDPLPVEADGTMDWDFDVQFIGGAAYILWQDADRAVSDDEATLDNIATVMGLSAAKFDAESKTFTTYALANGNAGVNLMPTLCGNGSTVTAVWVSNTEHDVFGNGSANDICVSTFDGSEWSESEKQYECINSIDSLAAAYTDGVLNVAYSAKTGDDITVISDTEVYLNGAALTADDVADIGVTYRNGVLYWFKNGALMSNTEEVVSAGHGLSSDRYEIINENDVKAILFTVGSGVRSGLYGVFYDEVSGEWGQATALTDSNDFIASFSAVVTEASELQIMVNRTAVNETADGESAYGESTIQIITIKPDIRLEVTDMYYSEETYVAGTNLLMQLTIANSGQSAANGIAVKIYDGDTLVSERTFDVTVYGGSSVTVDLSPVFDEIIQNRELTIKVYPSANAGDEAYCASTTVTLTQNDIAVENISWGMSESGKALIYANIVNRGYTVPGNSTVLLRRASADGEIIDSVAMNNLSTLETQHVKFEAQAQKNDVFYITIELENEDSNSANNADFVVIRGDDDDECQHEYVETITPASCTEEGSVTMTCSLCGDSYTKETLAPLGHNYVDGVCTRCGTEEVVLASGSCGEGLEWKLNADGRLTINGNGEIVADPAWGDYADKITSISIASGITSIAENAFAACPNVTDIYYDGTKAEWNAIKIAAGNDALTGATIHFAESLPGDVTGDGVVNVMDLIRLKKCIADGSAAEMQNMDINGDGVVNVLDLIRLKKIIAGA